MKNLKPYSKVKKSEIISNAEVEKYKLWAEQGYKSPYSRQTNSLTWLFGAEKRVEIDHIIPRSRYYDDSYGNKVLVEAEFNAEKRTVLLSNLLKIAKILKLA